MLETTFEYNNFKEDCSEYFRMRNPFVQDLDEIPRILIY